MTEPSRDWKEVVPEGEAARLEGLAEQLRDLQRKRATKDGAMRALHAKGQAQLEAELTVLADLPEHARVGMFASPKTFRAYVRFSNGAGTREADPKPDVRGVAVKVLGVHGPKIISGLEKATTQDFLFIQSPAVPFRDADEFVWFVVAAANPALLLPRAIFRLGPMGAIGLIRKLLKGTSRPIVSLATSTYYGALPIQYGPYAAKLVLMPQTPPDPLQIRPGTSKEYLTEELAARLAKGPVVYDLGAHFYVDERTTPIEDATVEWRTDASPVVPIARLTLPRQDLSSAHARKLAQRIETLSFDPWHTTADFRPLGQMMRARNAAYRLSTQERKAAPEPSADDAVDG
jgi:hypothetical protein